MRHVLPIAAVMFAVAVSAGMPSRPASAASADAAADRQPIMLAQNNSGGPNMFALFQDIQRLQEQVRDLRGQVDTLRYQLKQNEQGQRDLYENLDKRLSALEGGRGAVNDASGANGGGYGSAAGQTGPAGGRTGGAQQPESTAVQSQYMAAFKKLKNGQYDAAIGGFKGFLDQNPESSYSDNAWYWLGEANYVQQNYDAALQAFQTVVNRFRASSKVPGSLYKIGVIQDEQGETDNAKATLQRLIDQYPDADAAGLARKRLASLGG